MDTYFHPDQLLHRPQSYFSRGQMRTPQEIPSRAERLLEGVKTLGFPVRTPKDHGSRPLLAVHDIAYLRFLESAYRRWHAVPEDWGDEVMSNVFVRQGNALRGILAEAGRFLADGSCPIGEHTWRAAYGSAQSAIAGAHALLSGSRHAYALCRPPGHHARADGAGGFCYLNSSAMAAQVLRDQYTRVMVLDTDMHHGQGIQEIFYGRADVFYISIHGDPTNFYPVVCGFENERGVGAGGGYNLNLPMPHGSPEGVFFDRLEQAFSAIRIYEPDVLVLALGFDIYHEDPQAKVAVSSAGFEQLGRQIQSLDLPTLIVQEGGYHIDTLDHNLGCFFGGFLG
ncbi:histone deacetylase family protein [Castellaniella sp.]|uniref:histone deacetylase family protein n=1 Tax=Castellaniella sp. TaxID=1955812 RepID=UPI003565D642